MTEELTAVQMKAAEIMFSGYETKDEEAARTLKLILSSKAEGTLSLYSDVIKKWCQFAKKNGYQEFPIRKKEFCAYLSNLDKWGTPYSYLKALQGAIPFWYAARNSDETCLTKEPFVKLLLDGALRTAAKRRGSVQKVETIPQDKIKEMFKRTFWPMGRVTIPNGDRKAWRTATRLYTYYKTMCRYSCYKQLGPKNITFLEVGKGNLDNVEL